MDPREIGTAEAVGLVRDILAIPNITTPPLSDATQFAKRLQCSTRRLTAIAASKNFDLNHVLAGTYRVLRHCAYRSLLVE